MLADITNAKNTLELAVSKDSNYNSSVTIGSKQYKSADELLNWAKEQIKTSSVIFLNNILGYALDRAEEKGWDISKEINALGYTPPSIPKFTKRYCSRMVRIAGYADL
jgi:hypothetical protein